MADQHEAADTGRVRYTDRHVLRPHGLLCLDCGAPVLDEQAHTRFHSILGGHAWALAVLKTAHLASHIHDHFDVVERIDSRQFDSWSAEALAEVVAQLPEPSSEAS
jgi:hypothetical protein